MSVDMLRVEANERIDLQDFQTVAESGNDQASQINANFATNPDGQRAWILGGFGVTNPTGSQIRVTKGKAILARREAGDIKYGLLTSDGDTSRTIDIGSFATGVYGVYVRFEFIDADTAARIFWNATDNGFEYSHTLPTMRAANWSLRIEGSSPGAEWLRIATVNQVDRVITPRRPFYFEGAEDSSPAYASGWGTTNDRNTDRATYGVKDLQTFTAAVRQCLEDVKGRGIRKWYSKNIGGQNIGFDTDPTEFALYMRSTSFGLDYSSTTTPKLMLGDGTTGNTALTFNTSTNVLAVKVNAVDRLLVQGSATETRMYVRDNKFQLYIDHTNLAPAIVFDVIGSTKKGIRFSRTADSSQGRIEFKPTGGAENAGTTTDPQGAVDGLGFISNQYRIGDSQADGFSIGRVGNLTNGNPEFRFDNTDYMQYNRSGNRWDYFVSNIVRLRIGPSYGGISTPTVTVNDDTNFQLTFISAGDQPGILFDSNDYFRYVRSLNRYDFVVGGSVAAIINAAGISNVGTVSASSLVASGGTITTIVASLIGTSTINASTANLTTINASTINAQDGCHRSTGGAALRQIIIGQGTSGNSNPDYIDVAVQFRTAFTSTPSSVSFFQNSQVNSTHAVGRLSKEGAWIQLQRVNPGVWIYDGVIDVS